MRRDKLEKVFTLAIEDFPDRARSHFTIVDPENWWVNSSADDPLVEVRSHGGRYEGPWRFTCNHASYTVYGRSPGYRESIRMFLDDLGIDSLEDYKGKPHEETKQSKHAEGSRNFQDLNKVLKKKTELLHDRRSYETAFGTHGFLKFKSSKKCLYRCGVILGGMLILGLGVMLLSERKHEFVEEERVANHGYEENSRHQSDLMKRKLPNRVTRARLNTKEKHPKKLEQEDLAQEQLSGRSKFPKKNKSLTRNWMAAIAESIASYKRAEKQLPRDLRTLKAHVSSMRLRDEWGRELKYNLKEGEWTLMSSGKDGRWGTDDDIVTTGH